MRISPLLSSNRIMSLQRLSIAAVSVFRNLILFPVPVVFNVRRIPARILDRFRNDELLLHMVFRQWLIPDLYTIVQRSLNYSIPRCKYISD